MANDFDTGIMILRGANVVKGSSIFEEQGFSYGVVESVVRAASNNHRWGGTNAADCIVRLNKYGLLTIHNLNTLQHLAEEAPEKLSQIAMI